MDVYKNTYKQGYGGGCVLVAANSKEEAVLTYLANESTKWEWWYNGDKTPETDIENIDFQVFKFEDWEKVDGMHYDTQRPVFIFEHCYFE